MVTQARRSKSEDIAYRQRRYLIMMGVRAVCFLVGVALYVIHAGWLLVGIPVVGALFIPYFAVIFANGGREPDAARGFQEFQPRLPEQYQPPGSQPGKPGISGMPDAFGAPSQKPPSSNGGGHQDA